MDRLTGDFKGASMFATVEQARQYNRLRQYEDTGLTPDEIAALRAELEAAQKITGDTSDGYHTFNELYHHRALLFSVICNDRPEMAWKARKHHDGTMYDGMFIVGIQTPEGSATYHYDVDPYWTIFNVPEREFAPVWDGHTPAQAIERIGRLPALHAELDAAQKRAGAAERDLASVAMCATCKHADNDVCDATCGDSDSTYRWEWRGPDAGGESGESGEVVGDDDVHVAPSLDRSVGPD